MSRDTLRGVVTVFVFDNGYIIQPASMNTLVAANACSLASGVDEERSFPEEVVSVIEEIAIAETAIAETGDPEANNAE